MVRAKDYHKVLGLRKGASRRQIQEAYRRLALMFHPDRNRETGPEERFKEISEAYAILSGKQQPPSPVPAPHAHPHAGRGRRGGGTEVMDWSAEVINIWDGIMGRRNDNMYR